MPGTYAGATGSATVGVGVGANVLVGGSGNSIALQPVSIEGTTGLNVAAGIAEMTPDLPAGLTRDERAVGRRALANGRDSTSTRVAVQLRLNCTRRPAGSLYNEDRTSFPDHISSYRPAAARKITDPLHSTLERTTELADNADSLVILLNLRLNFADILVIGGNGVAGRLRSSRADAANGIGQYYRPHQTPHFETSPAERRNYL